jgi:hypothetical protein
MHQLLLRYVPQAHQVAGMDMRLCRHQENGVTPEVLQVACPALLVTKGLFP